MAFVRGEIELCVFEREKNIPPQSRECSSAEERDKVAKWDGKTNALLSHTFNAKATNCWEPSKLIPGT